MNFYDSVVVADFLYYLYPQCTNKYQLELFAGIKNDEEMDQGLKCPRC
jgi:hypothetical protein